MPKSPPGHSTTYVSLTEAAEIAGLEKSWLRRCIYARKLRAEKVGSAWVVRRSALEAFMAMERPAFGGAAGRRAGQALGAKTRMLARTSTPD